MSKAKLDCHGLTGTPVGYLIEDGTVVFECDECGRKVGSDVSRDEFVGGDHEKGS